MATRKAQKPNNRSTSFRGYPDILEPVREYALFKRRTLHGQLLIIVENYLETEDASKAIKAMQVQQPPMSSAVPPTPLRLAELQKQQVAEAVINSQMSMSLWMNHALLYCTTNKLLEPQDPQT